MHGFYFQIDGLPTNDLTAILAFAGAVVVVLVVLLAIVLRLLRKRRPSEAVTEDDLSIDVETLGMAGPVPAGPRLEYYGTPVRLIVLVLAPAGRGVEIPPNEQLRDTVEYLMPGLSEIIDLHQPILRRWPLQLSSQGFAQAFFHNVALPGEYGKGTPWCSAAGKFEFADGHLLAGFVCQAEKPNTLSQVIVEHVGKWHDVLRVRKEDA